MEYVVAAVVVLAVVVATYRVLGRWSAKRVERDFREPDEILTAARIYESYNRRQAAIDLLKAGLEHNPDHPELTARLAELSGKSES